MADNQIDRRSDSGFFQRKLQRNTDKRVVGGVCAGIADHFHIDPFWIRVVVFSAMWFAGTGLLLYIFAWIILPDSAAPALAEGGGNTALPADPHEIPEKDLREEAWREVNEITRN